VLCTRGVSQSVLPCCSHRSLSFAGRFLMVAGLWWHLRRW
jgi:hypothetical protein